MERAIEEKMDKVGNVTIAGLRFRLNCLVEQTRAVHVWTLRKKTDRISKERVYVVNQKTRNF
jgi:hypothetical protein